MADIEVAYYDKEEANKSKYPFAYGNFTYDNEKDGGVLAKFNDIGEKIKKIKDDIRDLNNNYKELSTPGSGKYYENFSNFSDSVNRIINTMNTRIDNIEQCFKNILDTAHQAVTEHSKEDATLIDDLGRINQLISGQYMDGIQSDLKKNTDGKITDHEETPVDDKYSMSKYLDKVADEIIQGKYGNGDDRFAELEKQGYNLRDRYDKNGNLIERGLQDIVNEKLNGTYDPNKTPSFNNSEAGYKGPTNNNSSSNTSGQNPSSTSGNSTGNTGSSTTSGNSVGNNGSSTTSGNSVGNSGSSTTSGNSADSQSSNSLTEDLVDINPIYYGGLKNIDISFEDVYKKSFQVEPFKTNFPQQSEGNLLEKAISGNSAPTTSGNGTYILDDDPYTGN